MTETRTPRYSTPTVTIASFNGEPMLSITGGRQRVLIRPSEAEAVVRALGMGLDFLGLLPTSSQAVER